MNATIGTTIKAMHLQPANSASDSEYRDLYELGLERPVIIQRGDRDHGEWHQHFTSIQSWLHEHCGGPGGRYVIVGYNNAIVIDFDEEKDQLFFILKWGNDGF